MSRLRGDTIIEVILAVTVFSAIAVGSMVIMNSGISVVQRSLEITLVRQQIDAQAEMLRYVFDRKGENDTYYVNMWNNDIATNVGTPTEIIDALSCPSSADLSNGFAFVPGPGGNLEILHSSTDYADQPDTYAKVDFGAKESQGISIQLTNVTGGSGPVAQDAYIQACWHAPGSPRPVTIGTIVRLYDAG